MNLVEYLGTEMRSFDELPFGAVDSAALAEFAMANPCGIVSMLPGDAVEAAGVPFIFAAYGFGSVEGFPSVDRPAGLLELLDL